MIGVGRCFFEDFVVVLIIRYTVVDRPDGRRLHLRNLIHYVNRVVKIDGAETCLSSLCNTKVSTLRSLQSTRAVKEKMSAI